MEVYVCCWFVDTASTVLLLFSAMYTSYKMRILYGGHISREIRNIYMIMTIFVMAFLAKTSYEWVMYDLYKRRQSEKVLLMLHY